MAKKKVVNLITQEELNTMSKEEAMNIASHRIPEGYDIDFSVEEAPQLVKLSEVLAAGGEPDEVVEEVSDVPVDPSPAPVEAPASNSSNFLNESEYRKLTPEQRYLKTKGILFLRFFSEDVSNGKVLTRLRKVVYFPQQQIKEGWYVACVVKEYQNHGVMDTIPLADVPLELWQAHSIKGAHTEYNYSRNTLDIYPALPKEKLLEEKPVCIYSINLPKDPAQSSGSSIREILEAKKSEALNRL